MHKEIMKVDKGMQLDHINREVKDNRLANLRPATPSQNQLNRTLLSSNTSGYKGVSLDNKVNKWRAGLTKDGVQLHLGFYDSKEDAAKAYNLKAEELYGESAILNDVNHDGFTLRIREKYSDYHGITYVKRANKWTSNILVKDKRVHLGSFDTSHDAARMYNFWAQDLHGEFARLNIIEEEHA